MYAVRAAPAAAGLHTSPSMLLLLLQPLGVVAGLPRGLGVCRWLLRDAAWFLALPRVQAFIAVLLAPTGLGLSGPAGVLPPGCPPVLLVTVRLARGDSMTGVVLPLPGGCTLWECFLTDAFHWGLGLVATSCTLRWWVWYKVATRGRALRAGLLACLLLVLLLAGLPGTLPVGEGCCSGLLWTAAAPLLLLLPVC